MALIEKKQVVKKVRGITAIEEKLALAFFQGAVYCWCKNRKNEWFSLRALMGGDNYHWDGTPLFILYQKHKKQTKNENRSIAKAAIDAGWLLKAALKMDGRNFERKYEDLTNKYRWVEKPNRKTKSTS